jgi:hypothetical protein
VIALHSLHQFIQGDPFIDNVGLIQRARPVYKAGDSALGGSRGIGAAVDGEYLGGQAGVFKANFS